MTFEFVSDGYITKQGWYAEVSCTNLDSLVFTVTDGLEPVTDANIIIGNKSRVTDNQGQAIFYLEPGTYEYIVSKTGYAEARGKTKLDGTTITNIVMNPPLCKLAFNVMDENTKAVEGAEVSIGDSLKTTDADGKTSFLFSASDYSYRVSKAGYTTEENNVNLGQDTTLDIQLYRIFEITFMAQDSITEDAIAGASISIDTFLFETGAEGTALADLAYGEYDYTVQADGYYNKNSSVVIDSEKSVNIKMRPLSDAVDNHGLAYNFRIYPNPVSGELYVETKYQPGTLVVQLYDLLGKVILSKQTDNHKLKFDVSDLPSGVYLLRLKQGKASQTRKLLIR